MTAELLDGKRLARMIQEELAEELVDFIQNNAVVPTLAAVLVGDDAASETYVRNKRRACEAIGMESRLHRLPADVSQEDLFGLIARLNRDREIHGILVQLPLPEGIDPLQVQQAINPAKDVDAFHPENVGKLVQGQPRFVPCTPHGIQQLLLRSGVEISGRHAVIVGRSDIVGKPLAILLSSRDTRGNATVTLCHSHTRDLAHFTRQADILVVAIGRPRFVTAEMIRPGAVVVDVGIHRTPQGIVGDVDFDAARQVAGRITPVPGGVGPLTVTMLLYNTLQAAKELERF